MRNKEINIASLSFIDLLTISIGGLGVAAVFGALAFLKSSEALSELSIVTESIPRIQTTERVDFYFSAIGGLEPYLWSIKKNGDCDSSEVSYGLPAGLEWTGNGKISGKIDLEALENTDFCIDVVVNGLSTNDELTQLEKKLQSEITERHDNGELTSNELKSKIASYKFSKKRFYLIVSPPTVDIGSQLLVKKIPKILSGKKANIDFSLSESFSNSDISLKSAQLITRNGVKIDVVDDITIIDRKIILSNLDPGKLFLSLEVLTKRHPFNSLTQLFELNLEVIAGELFDTNLMILGDELPVATEFERYYFRFFVKGGVPPLDWKVEGLPKGITFDNENAILKGRPSNLVSSFTHSEFPLLVSVSDKTGSKSSKELLLRVDQRKSYIDDLQIVTKLTGLKKRDFFLGERKFINFEARGGIPPYIWKATSINGRFNENTLVLTPVQEGKLTFKVILTDSHGLEETEKYYEIIIKRKPMELDHLDKYMIYINDSTSTNNNVNVGVIVRGGIPPYNITVKMTKKIHLEDSIFKRNKEDSFYTTKSTDTKLNMVLSTSEVLSNELVDIQYIDSVGTLKNSTIYISAVMSKDEVEVEAKKDSTISNDLDTNVSEDIAIASLQNDELDNLIISLKNQKKDNDISIKNYRFGCGFSNKGVCYLRSGIVGIPYSVSIVDLPEESNIEAEAEKNSIPKGLVTGSIGKDYYIYGTPDECGDFSIPISFHDGVSNRDIGMEYNINVQCRFEAMWDIFTSYF